MIDLFKNIVTYRELLFTLSESYIKARYKQTILGGTWAVVPPLLLVFTAVAFIPNLSTRSPELLPYSLFVFVGFWFWAFFANALSFAIPNVAQNSPLLRKVYFPREILVLAAIVPSILDFLIGLPVLLFIMFLYQVPFHLSLLLLPFVFITELFLVFGLSCAGAIANVAFRDVSKFLPILLQILLFSSPVIYALSDMNPTYSFFIRWNPLTGIFDTARSFILPRYPFHMDEFFAAFIISILVAYLGYRLFKLGERVIVDIA